MASSVNEAQHGDMQTVRVDENVFATMEKTVTNFDQLNIDAKHGTQYELEMSVWKAIKTYPKATFFSFMLSLSLIMEGYGVFWEES
jgi:phage-related protein